MARTQHDYARMLLARAGQGDADRARSLLGEAEDIARDLGMEELARQVGVVVSRGNGPKGQLALDAEAAILPYYNDYFGTPFPLPKLDNVAGPGQSQFFSAMENWGAIFTFERSLLNDPAITSDRISRALAQFVRSVVSYRSRFDDGMVATGDVGKAFSNFTDEENQGKALFLGKARCEQRGDKSS